MTGYARARPAGHWLDYPDTTYGTVGSAEFEKWDDAVEKLKRIVLDPRDYGALVNNTADDTAAYQAALDDAASTTAGGLVLIPGRSLFTQLLIRSKTGLMGRGWGSMLTQKAGTTGDALILSDVSAQWSVLRDFRLYGNKTNQTAANHGVFYDNTAGSFDFNDSMHLVQNVLVDNFKGRGVYLGTNCREARLLNVQSRNNDQQGYYMSGTDNFAVGCSAGMSGLAGFHLASADNELVSCKSFYSGQAMTSAATVGDGFYIAAARGLLYGCRAQDNWRHGFMFDGASDSRADGCVADANGQSAFMTAAGAGFFLQNSSRIRVSGHSFDRNGTPIQGYGIRFGTPASTNCYADLFINNVLTNQVAGATINGAGAASNVVKVNTVDGFQVRTYTATLTPDFTIGGTLQMTLTGNTTVNEPGRKWGGMRVTYVFTQDGTGGRTVTFAAAYKTNWTPNTAAGKTNTISFVYDGTNWIQTDATVGL